MDRPKSVAYVPIKMPDELLADITRCCQRHPEGKSVSEWIKDACEFRLTVIHGLQIGYYTLRTIPYEAQPKDGVKR